MATDLLSKFLTGFLLLTMAACTPSGGGGNDSAKPQFLGDLDKAVSEIYGAKNEPYFEKCDLEWKDKALEVSHFLEAHREEINQFYSANLEIQGKDKYNLIKMGQYTFRELKKQVMGTDTWREDLSSWAVAYKAYQNIKDLPVDMNWVRLNTYVRGMIPDEEDRLTAGYNMGLSKDSGPLAQTVYEKVQACVDERTCTTPKLTGIEFRFLEQGIAHKWLINRLLYTEKDSFEKRREYLNELSNLTYDDKSRYGFFPSSIATIKGKQIEIPMDLTIFGTEADLFIKYVESEWNNNGEYSVKIIPTKSPQPTYFVSADFLVGKRASVSGKKMKLHQLDITRTFAHEFGHVLGFMDNYYTTWNPSTCVYTYQTNAGDMMSDHWKGQVLPRHWETIKKNYWKQ